MQSSRAATSACRFKISAARRTMLSRANGVPRTRSAIRAVLFMVSHAREQETALCVILRLLPSSLNPTTENHVPHPMPQLQAALLEFREWAVVRPRRKSMGGIDEARLNRQHFEDLLRILLPVG